MATKNNPGKYDCYAAAEPDEPLFILRANDPSAPSMVRGWAWNRAQAIFQGHKDGGPEAWAKVQEALDCAKAMETWRAAKYPQPQGAVVVTAVISNDGSAPQEPHKTKH